MNIFDVFIIQPIFNALMFLYGYIGDFGLSIIIFTVFVRIALWPLIKKQLHQTKLMRKVQPELKRIKKQTKGNRQLEAQLMMELYREKGIKPFSSIGVLIIQLPIFIAIYQVINIISQHQDQISKHLYDFIKEIPRVNDVISSNHQFNETFLGFVDLTQNVFSNQQFHFALFILAILTAVLQYVQTKQIMPNQGSQKKLRDILKDASNGKEADQSEIMASMSNNMMLFMPIMLFAFALYLPGAVVLYYATSSFIAIIQQHFALKQDEEEMIEIANEEKPTERNGKNGTVIRIKKAKNAKIVSSKKTKKRSRKGGR